MKIGPPVRILEIEPTQDPLPGPLEDAPATPAPEPSRPGSEAARGHAAYPQRLQLVCPRCLWDRGPAQARPDQVVRAGRDGLVPLCDEHLANAVNAGLPRLRAVVPAREIEAALIGTYAVDLLRLE